MRRADNRAAKSSIAGLLDRGNGALWSKLMDLDQRVLPVTRIY
jgi:hypothetical protein